MFVLTESSHDIVESSRYIQRDRSHMLEQDAFMYIVFERRVGQYYMCVEILLYSAISFISKLNEHVIAANCPYAEIPGIVLNEETNSQEREMWKRNT